MQPANADVTDVAAGGFAFDPGESCDEFSRIARQSADWIETRGAAGQAFGRVQALDGALARLVTRR